MDEGGGLQCLPRASELSWREARRRSSSYTSGSSWWAAWGSPCSMACRICVTSLMSSEVPGQYQGLPAPRVRHALRRSYAPGRRCGVGDFAGQGQLGAEVMDPADQGASLEDAAGRCD